MLAAVSVGGVVGALGRYGLIRAFPYGPGGFPWVTVVINVLGCLLIGLLMTVITEISRPHPLVRPLLGVGVLGGFTTFSTYIVDAQRGLDHAAPWTSLAALAVTPVAALAAVHAGARAARRLAARQGEAR